MAEWLGALVLSHKARGFDPQQRRSPVFGLRQPTEVDSAALCGSENPKKRTLRFSGTNARKLFCGRVVRSLGSQPLGLGVRPPAASLPGVRPAAADRGRQCCSVRVGIPEKADAAIQRDKR